MLDREPGTDAPAPQFEAQYREADDRALVGRALHHPRRLMLPIVLLVLTSAAFSFAQHAERRDSAFWRGLAEQHEALLTLAVATAELPLAAEQRVSLSRAITRGVGAAAHAGLQAQRLEPWIDAGAMVEVGERLESSWAETAAASRRAARTAEPARALRADVLAFESVATGILVAVDELVDTLARARAEEDTLAQAGRQLMLIQRMSTSAGRVLQGRHAALVAVDRFGRDAVRFGEVNNAMLNGGRGLDIRRIENEDARVILEHLGREYRASAPLIERIMHAVDASTTHELAVAELRRGMMRVQSGIDALRGAYRDQAIERPQLGVVSWLLAALTALALLGAAVGLRRDANHARRVALRRAAYIAERRKQIDGLSAERARAEIELERLAEFSAALVGGRLGESIESDEPLARRLAAGLSRVSERFEIEVQDLRDRALELEALAARVDTGVQVVKSALTEQTERVKRAARGGAEADRMAESLAASGAELTEITRESTQVANTVTGAVREACADLDLMVLAVKESAAHGRHVVETTAGVRELGESIGELGEEAKMLSLNVAIQASMNCESGAGLGRFADDVQRLAERARQANRRIESVNAGLREAADGAGDAIKRASWSSTTAFDRVRALDPTLAGLERAARHLERVHMKLAEPLLGHRAQVREVGQLVDAAGGALDNVHEAATASADTVGRLSEALGDLNERLARFDLRKHPASAPTAHDADSDSDSKEAPAPANVYRADFADAQR